MLVSLVHRCLHVGMRKSSIQCQRSSHSDASFFGIFFGFKACNNRLRYDSVVYQEQKLEKTTNTYFRRVAWCRRMYTSQCLVLIWMTFLMTHAGKSVHVYMQARGSNTLILCEVEDLNRLVHVHCTCISSLFVCSVISLLPLQCHYEHFYLAGFSVIFINII